MAPPAVKGAKGANSAVNGDAADTIPSVPKKPLFDDESSSEEDQEEGGVQLKINEEYARRFEYNKKREELQRLQEKYKGKNILADDDEEEESSESETEDDDAVLMTEELDREISATLQAIRNRDPKIYDKNTVFYTPFDPDKLPTKKEEKPMTLRDYHRERYLSGDVGAEDDKDGEAAGKKTYVQEQEEIKKSIISEINRVAAENNDDEDWSDDDAFIKPVKREEAEKKPTVKLTEEDIANADKNPEEFLEKFMASKAWLPEDKEHNWQAFESDEGEGDDIDLAEEFEHAYNMRFEDPEKSNEFLQTYSRRMAAMRSARKEEISGRKKKRQEEKERKEREKKEREAERARLRKLKIEEASEKLAKIKEAAGIRGKDLKEEEWLKILEDAWDDDKWEEVMQKYFGDEYYNEADEELMSSDEEEGEDGKKKKKKPKKPKWDDDIDIKDIVPDFEDKPPVTLSDEEKTQGEAAEAEQDEESGSDSEDEGPAKKKRKTTKDIKKERIAAKKQAKAELAKIEQLVDTKMELENPRALEKAALKDKKRLGLEDGMPKFRYREVSPESFGLTARDILLAPSDAALNQFAGLKKLATFREPEKKAKDKKRLGKKARLRKWRREVFGKEYEKTGPTYGFEKLLAENGEEAATGANSFKLGKRREKEKSKDKKDKKESGQSGEPGSAHIIDGERKKKRKRSKKNKNKSGEAAAQ
ncbi:uncharacterized protein CTHT_0070630 [Thermochaetoides thermophila DSM 1495]|uniref:Kri1-like C-terminal domain-containing protein n=1 Tax=Chaetomium thermophilum (strain DSM 1495 / CBS 144.50 / IMI 039719) TaxID=759272 RepID=G0SHN1_CHATD|nr:hypothetical protein CTHT_0070630 [Thermochaetoides thermophila DSM 1495]EGS17720.1 hypothetical protein CTHT_0070630 [Thermochaetoides thermophila DSM 1495]